MTLTPLETLLGGALVSFITGVSVRLFMGGAFVTRQQCRLNHEQDCRNNGSVQRKLDIQFRMLRALIIHSDLPVEKKEEILNERGDGL
ncbi:hypothetical protein [Desulfocurvus sp. DL9XJH121]